MTLDSVGIFGEGSFMQRFASPVAYEPTPWLRGPARFSRGWIELDHTRAEEYQPYELRGIVFDFAGIHTPAEAVQFVERYGLLWAGPQAREFREPWEAWLEEIHALHTTLALYSMVRQAVDGDQDALAALRLVGPSLAQIFKAPAENDEELLEQASVAVAWLISENLDGVEQRVAPAVLWDRGDGQPGAPGEYLIFVRTPHLLGYIYSEFALLVVGRVPMMQCHECGRLFPLHDARQRFCSARCANRQRYRRWAERRRAEGTSQ
jgi:hypothetical protein